MEVGFYRGLLTDLKTCAVTGLPRGSYEWLIERRQINAQPTFVISVCVFYQSLSLYLYMHIYAELV